MRENLHRTVSLLEVAQEIGMSRYHFQRTFLRQTHETPNHYLSRLRIEKACRRLATRPASVTEVAGLFGFTNPGRSSVFRRATGFSPSTYRRLRRR